MNTIDDHRSQPMTVGDWFVTILILALPLVNIIMYFYWALSSTGNINRKNFCIASLLWVAIGFGLFLVFLMFGGLIAALSGS